MSRRGKMRADVQAIISACDIDPDCPFKGAHFTSSFHLSNIVIKKYFRIYVRSLETEPRHK